MQDFSVYILFYKIIHWTCKHLHYFFSRIVRLCRKQWLSMFNWQLFQNHNCMEYVSVVADVRVVPSGKHFSLLEVEVNYFLSIPDTLLYCLFLCWVCEASQKVDITR